MQVDLSESRSRAFNLYLRYHLSYSRFIQMGISLLVSIIVVRFYAQQCNASFYGIVMVCAIILLFISFIALMCFRCREGFGKTLFFVLLGFCILATGVGLVVSFVGIGQSNVCASNLVTYRFIVIDILLTLVIAALILFGPFFWVQRYTNSPGNIVWVFMFFGFSWNGAYGTMMIFIGILALLVSLASILVNAIAGFTGITSSMKKAVTITWTAGMVVMLINEVLAIATYMQNSKYNGFIDLEAKKLLLLFVIINGV